MGEPVVAAVKDTKKLGYTAYTRVLHLYIRLKAHC